MIRLRKFYLLITFFSFLIIPFIINWVYKRRTTNSQAIPYNHENKQLSNLTGSIKRSHCFFEDQEIIDCFNLENEFYIPYNKFIRDRFELHSDSSNETTLHIWVSDAKIRQQERNDEYTSFSKFGPFSTYNVEFRDRVRCLHPIYGFILLQKIILNVPLGVPMSIQWDSVPYFYPIQVSQFALQHYSRLSNKNESRSTRAFNITKDIISGRIISRVDLHKNLHGLILKIKPIAKDGFFSIFFENESKNESLIISLKFIDDSRCVWSNSKNKIFYSLGQFNSTLDYVDLTLDLNILLFHAQRVSSYSKTSAKEFIPLYLQFNELILQVISIKQTIDLDKEMFLNGANWLIENQDQHGRWTTPVFRKIADVLLLNPGWPSAMAQGHALSVLTRAYHLTNNHSKYSESAYLALLPFSKSVNDGGIVNEFFGYKWFEEYPTTPGTFVLNGFLFSLIGLYDYSSLNASSIHFFETGVQSLKALLPLFDTGQRSLYDLRHITLKIEPNIARWSYHALHIYLLKWLHQITGEKYFYEVAERWTLYAHGYRAKHN